MNISRNEIGFGLIELCASLAISSAVILGATYLFKNSKENTSAKNTNLSENLNLLSKLMKSKKICQDTLMTKNIGDFVEVIKGHDYYKTGKSLQEQNLLKSMQLISNPNWEPVPDAYGPVSLKVIFQKQNALITKYIPLNVQLDDNKKVVSCSPKLTPTGNEIYERLCMDVVKGILEQGKCKRTKSKMIRAIGHNGVETIKLLDVEGASLLEFNEHQRKFIEDYQKSFQSIDEKELE